MKPQITFPIFLFILLFLFAAFSNSYGQVNLALSKPVTGSSAFNQPAANLVDGNLTSYMEVANTLTGANTEWVQIDLGADYYIDSIVITNRAGTLLQQQPGRKFMLITYPSVVSLPANPADVTSYLGLSVFNRFIYKDSLTGTDGNPFARTVTSTPNAAGSDLGPVYTARRLKVGIHKARYVRIAAINNDLLSLAEVEVFATKVLPVRVFSNGDFEANGITVNSNKIAEDAVPGWNTTEGRAGLSNYSFSQGGVFEMWGGGTLGVPAFNGIAFIELNAAMSSEVSQNPICVRAGETFTWAFAHRGRGGEDVMALRIDDIDVAQITDNNASTGTHSISILTPLTTTGSRISTRSTGWGVYQGTWTNTSAVNKIVTFGFRAVSAVGGITIGNFLDSVALSGLTPAASMQSAATTGPENNSVAALPKIYINGRVSSSQTVQIAITGGTAVRGTDYTTPGNVTSINLTVPVGTYDGTDATAITIPNFITVLQDCIEDPGETIIFRIQNPTAGLLTPGDGACGEGSADFTFNIRDSVSDLGNLSAVWPFASAGFSTVSTDRAWLGILDPTVPCSSNITRNDGFKIFQQGTVIPVAGSGTQALPWILAGSGSNYTAQVIVNGSGASKPVYWAAWYDADGNGSFNDAIDLFQSGTTNHGSPVAITFDFTVPTGNGPTSGVLRIAATSVNTTFIKAMNGQVSLTNGEIEDYYVSYLSPLPVQLSDLKATVISNSAVKLNWATFAEQNNKGFEVEHSSNGTNWSVIGFVATQALQGNSNTALNYQFIHNNPLGKMNYYRLKQIDMDGRFNHSSVAIANLNATPGMVTIFPNPVTDKLNLLINDPAIVKEIRLYDITGKVITVFNGFRQQIDMSGFAAGVYHLLIIKTDNSKQQIRVVK